MRCSAIFILSLMLCGCHLATDSTNAPNQDLQAPTVTVPAVAEPVQLAGTECDETIRLLEEGLRNLQDGMKDVLARWQRPFIEALTHAKATKAAIVVAEQKVSVAVESAKADAKKDQKTAADLDKTKKDLKEAKAVDPVRWWLQYGGLGLIGLSVTTLVLSFIYVWLSGFRPLAFAGLAIGMIAVTLAKYLAIIEWVIIGTIGGAFLVLLAFIGWYVWRHHARIVPWIEEEAREATTTKPSTAGAA